MANTTAVSGTNVVTPRATVSAPTSNTSTNAAPPAAAVTNVTATPPPAGLTSAPATPSAPVPAAGAPATAPQQPQQPPYAGAVRRVGAAPNTGAPNANSANARHIPANYVAAVSGDVAFVRKPDGSWSRGFIKVAAEPSDTGCVIKVTSGHQSKNEDVTLILQARVRHTTTDPNDATKKITEEKVITLDIMHTGKINPDGFESESKFEVDYDKINAYLAHYQPGLQLSPGTPLAVYAAWDNSHQWGGYARDGIVYIPQRLQNPLSAAGASGANDPLGGPVPLDIGVQLSEDLVKANTWYGPHGSTEVLARGGQFMSRVESEVKVEVPYDKGNEVARRLTSLIQLTNDAYVLEQKAKTDPSVKGAAEAKQAEVKSTAERIFGRGWNLSIEDVRRFYEFDAAGKLVLDAEGLPKVMPMLDRYYDSQDGKLAQRGIALRFRETPKDPMGLVNIKMPSPGDLPNPTNLAGLIGRYDTGIQTVKGIRSTPEALTQFFDSTEHLNAFKYIREAIPGLTAKDVLKPAMDLTTRRYKIMLEHESGTSVEISLDHVTAVALDEKGNVRLDASGKPMVATFWQDERDLEHLQLNSNNQASNTGAAAFGALGQFSTEDEQDKWLKKLGGDATLSGPPRIHRPSDVTNPSIIDSEAYKLLLDVGPRSHQHLLGFTPRGAMQKYAWAARLTGIVPLTPEQQAAHARDIAVSTQARDLYAQTWKPVEEDARRLSDDAKKKSDAVREAGGKVAQEYSSLRYGKFSNLIDALSRNAEAQSARTPVGEKRRAAERLEKAQAELAKELGDVETHMAAYEQARLAAGLKPSTDESQRLTKVRAGITALTAAYEQKAKIVADAEAAADRLAAASPNDAQVAQRARVMKEEATKQGNEIVQKAEREVRALLDDSAETRRINNEALNVGLIAEGKVTQMRSDTVWRAVDAVR
jgi:hypothetical protein